MVQDILRFLLEADDEPFKEVFHPEVESIDVAIKTWWRRGYGGEYHTARVYVNGNLVTVRPENGGSDNVALYDAFRWLNDAGYIALQRNESPRFYCEKNGIKLNVSTQEVRRERDLDKPL